MRHHDTRVRVHATVDFGEAELIPDSRNRHGWRLLVDGVDQSYIDLEDPLRLNMIYAQLFACVVDAAAVPRSPLRVLHFGAGGLTVARYVHASRRGSTQLVVEIDRRLSQLVHSQLPMESGGDVRTYIADARDAVEELDSDSFDLVLTDAYHGGRLPPRIAGAEFAAHAARVLAPGGLYAANVLDMPGLALTRRQAATLRTAFADVSVLSTTGMLKGKRDGNVLLVAADAPGGVPVDRLKRAARSRLSLGVRAGKELDRFVAGAAPVTSDSE